MKLMSSNEDDENENDKTLMSSNDDDENENGNEDDDDDETMNQNKKYNNKKFKWLFRWNNSQIKIIWRANEIVNKTRKSRKSIGIPTIMVIKS